AQARAAQARAAQARAEEAGPSPTGSRAQQSRPYPRPRPRVGLAGGAPLQWRAPAKGSSVHEAEHRGVFPTQQALGRAEADQGLPDLARVDLAVVRQRHDAVLVDETALAFRAPARRLQILADELGRLQRVKHHGLPGSSAIGATALPTKGVESVSAESTSALDLDVVARATMNTASRAARPIQAAEWRPAPGSCRAMTLI